MKPENMNIVDPNIFKQSTLTIAKQLIGCTLIHNTPNGLVGGIICETEAYTQEDPACHAYQGRQTPRNQIMFQSPGHIYIYFIYGMYHCLNVVTDPEGTGAAVLIRGIIPTVGYNLIKANRSHIKKSDQWCNGPSKLMLAMAIPASLNGCYLYDDNCPLRVYERTQSKPVITTHPRIGISEAIDYPWRFVLEK